MKKKGVQRKVIIFITTLILLCSFSFPCFAESDFYDSELWDYEDSYVSPKSTEERKLFFVPLIPETPYHNYFIFYYNNAYYAYVADPGLDNSFYIFGRSRIISYEPYQMYKYEIGLSNNWEPIEGGAGYYSVYNGMVVVDTTKTVQSYSIGDPVADRGVVNNTGYRIYWTLSLILKMVLNKLSSISDYVLQHELLHYIVMACFAGEVVFFVFRLIIRIGDLKHEEVED